MSGGRSRVVTVAAIAAVLVLGLAAAQSVRYWAATIGFPFSLDYGEGPLLDQSVRLAHGQAIYRIPGAQPPWTIANYPPLYPLLVSAGVDVRGPTYAVGRGLAVAGTLVAAVFVSSIVLRWTRRRLAAATSGLLVLAGPYASYWTGFARVDTVALALSLAGLWVIIHRPRSNPALGVAVVLLTAAIFTKQTYLLSAPLAATVALAQVSRRRAAAFAAVLAAAVVIIGGGLVLITHGGFWYDVITANVNAYDLDLLAFYGVDLLQHVPVLLGLTVVAVLLSARRRHPASPVLAAYLAGSVIIALTAGKVGSALNYLLELSVAMSLAVGLLLGTTRAPVARLVVIIAVLLQAVWWVVVPHPYRAETFEATRHRTDVEHLDDLVVDADGPVLADQDLGLLPPAGRAIDLQPFELTQLAEAGRWDQRPVVDAIERHAYALIMIYTIPEWAVEETRWTPEQLAAVRQDYVLAETVPRQHGATLVYRPR